ncbi:MAG TPA: hypothetical protein V6D22_02265 [Candidatus Obscuribacterales bacterium]
MSAQVTSMLAYRMRQLATEHGNSCQVAETVKRLLERERDMYVARAALERSACAVAPMLRAVPSA